MNANAFATHKQLAELGTSLTKALLDIEDAPRDWVQKIITTPGRVNEIARSIVVPETKLEPTRVEIIHEPPNPCAKRTTDEQVLEWKVLFEKEGFSFTELGLIVPNRISGFDRLIVVPQGMTPQRGFNLCAKHFRVWKWCGDESLDVVVTHEDRSVKDVAYCVWVEDSIEPNEAMKNISAGTHTKRGTKTETLTERELHEFKYFSETRKHLDLKNWTLCAGSRYRVSSVPYASWDDDRFYVTWNYVSSENPRLRSRAVVAL